MEILAHRVIWSLVLLIGLVWWQGRIEHVRRAWQNRRTRNLLVIAAILVGLNWGMFIWATMNGYTLEAAMGYYTVPLLSAALGVLVLKERLRRLQWVALAIALVGVIYVTWEHHAIPWVGLWLAITWAIYGYVKKRAGVDAIESLMIETTLLLPLAIIYLIYLQVQGQSTFITHGPLHALLLASAGIFTASPLLLYGAAVVRLQLITIGFLQYISSTIQFFIAIAVFHDPMPLSRFVGFVITWTALAVLSVDAVRSRHGLPPEAIVEPD